MLIDDIPLFENDEFEFKSSLVDDKELRKKIAAAASGFSNTGGGYFIAGMDDDGNVDGGVSDTVGRQSRKDWVDVIIQQVEPTPKYKIEKLKDVGVRGKVSKENHLLIIQFFNSANAPHMSNDKKYYVRAGAHTVPARSFIVEALWAKRNIGEPRLLHRVRLKPEESGVVQIGVVAASNEPALNVEVNLNPLSSILQSHEQSFPLKLAILDQNNPFFLDFMAWNAVRTDPAGNTEITVDYEDRAGNKFQHQAKIVIKESFGPLELTIDKSSKLVKAIEKIATEIKAIEKIATEISRK